MLWDETGKRKGKYHLFPLRDRVRAKTSWQTNKEPGGQANKHGLTILYRRMNCSLLLAICDFWFPIPDSRFASFVRNSRFCVLPAVKRYLKELLIENLGSAITITTMLHSILDFISVLSLANLLPWGSISLGMPIFRGIMAILGQTFGLPLLAYHFWPFNVFLAHSIDYSETLIVSTTPSTLKCLTHCLTKQTIKNKNTNTN